MPTATHARWMALLLLGAVALLAWQSVHCEVAMGDGVRYVEHAMKLAEGRWRDGLIGAVDHPLHPLGIATVHGILGGEGPESWQRAAVLASMLAAVLTVIPVYLVALEIAGPRAAWLGCLLFLSNRVYDQAVIDVLSESTFLLFWCTGLWAVLRFLREGRLPWLLPAIAAGALAYLSRPEGMLLPLALVATLVLLPLHGVTRIHWRRWGVAMGVLVVGPLLVLGPFLALKGGVGTKPSIQRLLGTKAPAPAHAMEREAPLDPSAGAGTRYGQSLLKVLGCVEFTVTDTLLPFALLGLIAAVRRREVPERTWLFLAILGAASLLALTRLDATAGYCTPRHTLIPSMILIILAARGGLVLYDRIVIDARWLGRAEGRYRPGPAVWAVLLAWWVLYPLHHRTAPYKKSFEVYRQAGAWLAQSTRPGQGKILDLTNWSLFFSGRRGYPLGSVLNAANDPATRWVVAREVHLRSGAPWNDRVRQLLRGRRPAVLFPPEAQRRQIQVAIFDLSAPLDPTADASTVWKKRR